MRPPIIEISEYNETLVRRGEIPLGPSTIGNENPN